MQNAIVSPAVTPMHTLLVHLLTRRVFRDRKPDDLGQLSGITSMDPGVDPITLLYDSNGNRIESSDGTSTRTYTWDWNNRLDSVYLDNLTTDYAYLGDNTRLSTTTRAGTTTNLSLVNGVIAALQEGYPSRLFGLGRMFPAQSKIHLPVW